MVSFKAQAFPQDISIAVVAFEAYYNVLKMFF